MLRKKELRETVSLFFGASIIGFLINTFWGENSSIELTDFNSVDLFLKILSNNLIAIFCFVIISLLGSIFVKSFLALNGLAVGLIIGRFLSIDYFLLLLPHGLIEIPALLFLAYTLLCAISKNKYDKYTVIGISICSILITIGAFIEAFITPWVVTLYFS